MKSNIVEEFYDNGKIRTRYSTNEHGQKHGQLKIWSYEGTLWCDSFWVNGNCVVGGVRIKGKGDFTFQVCEKRIDADVTLFLSRISSDLEHGKIHVKNECTAYCRRQHG